MSKSEQKRIAVQKGNPMDLYAKATEAERELRVWQLLIIKAASYGLIIDEDTIKEYRRAVLVHNRYSRLIVGDMCK